MKPAVATAPSRLLYRIISVSSVSSYLELRSELECVSREYQYVQYCSYMQHSEYAPFVLRKSVKFVRRLGYGTNAGLVASPHWEMPEKQTSEKVPSRVTNHVSQQSYVCRHSTTRESQRPAKDASFFLGLRLRLRQSRKDTRLEFLTHLSLKCLKTLFVVSCTSTRVYCYHPKPFPIIQESSVSFFHSDTSTTVPVSPDHSLTTPHTHIKQNKAAMKFMLSSFLTLGGRNSKSIEPDTLSSKTTTLVQSHNASLTTTSSISSTSSSTNTKKRKSYMACQRFIGRPMTRTEAMKKMDTCKNFRDMVVTLEGDAIQNAIGLEYGSRLRSCVERSKRNLYHHGNRAHY